MIHMQSENGSVAMMRRMETRAKSRAQHPGPSGSAAIKKDKRKSLGSVVKRKRKIDVCPSTICIVLVSKRKNLIFSILSKAE